MPEEFLLHDMPATGVLRLRLHRPERRNALATPLILALADALDAGAQDPGVRTVLIVGSDTVFAAGADLDELARSGSGDPVDSPRYRGWERIRAFQKPLIAAVEGWCLGAGCELAMCCDIVVAGQGATFGQPETNLGIIPGAGGTATLARLIGRARAMHMVLTGEGVSAGEAHAIGLIASLVPTGQAEADALATAVKIAGRAPTAMRAAKASVRDATNLFESDHIAVERRRFIALLGTEDKAEGLAAFREKRLPVWQDR